MFIIEGMIMLLKLRVKVLNNKIPKNAHPEFKLPMSSEPQTYEFYRLWCISKSFENR